MKLFFWSCSCLWLIVSGHYQALAQDYPADPAPNKLTVATWNLEWFFDHETNDNRSEIAKEQSTPSREVWEWKKNAIASSIAQMKPTILALQEIEGKNVLYELANELRNKHQLTYRIAFVEGFDGSTEQDVGILFQSGCLEYSRREQNNRMFGSQDFYSLSKHLFAKFAWDASGHTEPLTVLTVHLRAREEAAKERRKQARDQIARGENVILLGDLNLESQNGTPMADDDGIEALTGKLTNASNDDLVDLHEKLPADQRRTHLVLDKQFDRILVSRSMIEDNPSIKDWVFEKIEVLPNLVVRGNDSIEDHWEKRYTKPVEERELSDHFPLMATFELK
jgi:endonuclease/exonuclease/phosphatase family metal-dependent hydrolase